MTALTDTIPSSTVAASQDERHFRTEHLMGNLKGRSVRGGAVTLAAQGIKFVLQMGSTIVLARLLSPADFGLVAMVTAVTGFVALFKDAGLSMATVQRDVVTHEQISTLFWINVVLSAGVMLVAAILAPGLAWFYSEPQLKAITLVLAGSFLFGGMTVQHQALLRRQMRFGALAVVEVLSMLTGILVALLMAWQNAGYWALVGMALASAAANCLLVWMFSGWRPGRPRRGSGAGAMLRFGGHLTGFNIVNHITRNADNVLIGAVWGAGPLGVYSKAYALLLLPLNQINAPVGAVTIPTLSRLQNDKEGFRNYYCQSVKLLAYIAMPLIVMLAVLAQEIVLIVLGPQWNEAALIFMIFAIFGVPQSVSTTTGWVLTAVGRSDRMFRWTVFYGMPVALTAFGIGVLWGPVGVAIAATAQAMLMVTPQMLYAYHGTPVRMRDVLTAVRAPFTLSLLVLAVGAGIKWLLGSESEFIRTAGVIVGGSAIWAFWMAFIPSAREEWRLVSAILLRRNLLRSDGSAAGQPGQRQDDVQSEDLQA